MDKSLYKDETLEKDYEENSVFMDMCISKRNVNYIISIFSQILGIICTSYFKKIFFLDCSRLILNKNAICFTVIHKIRELRQSLSVT